MERLPSEILLNILRLVCGVGARARVSATRRALELRLVSRHFRILATDLLPKLRLDHRKLTSNLMTLGDTLSLVATFSSLIQERVTVEGEFKETDDEIDDAAHETSISVLLDTHSATLGSIRKLTVYVCAPKGTHFRTVTEFERRRELKIRRLLYFAQQLRARAIKTRIRCSISTYDLCDRHLVSIGQLFDCVYLDACTVESAHSLLSLSNLRHVYCPGMSEFFVERLRAAAPRTVHGGGAELFALLDSPFADEPDELLQRLTARLGNGFGDVPMTGCGLREQRTGHTLLQFVCERNFIKTTALLLERDPSEINVSRDAFSASPLAIICKKWIRGDSLAAAKQRDFMTLLAAHGARPTRNWRGCEEVHWLFSRSTHENVLHYEQLFGRFNARSAEFSFGRTVLHEVLSGDSWAVDALLERGSLIDAVDDFGVTPLALHANGGFESAIPLCIRLIERGATLRKVGKMQRYPIAAACRLFQMEPVVSAMLDRDPGLVRNYEEETLAELQHRQHENTHAPVDPNDEVSWFGTPEDYSLLCIVMRDARYWLGRSGLDEALPQELVSLVTRLVQCGAALSYTNSRGEKCKYEFNIPVDSRFDCIRDLVSTEK